MAEHISYLNQLVFDKKLESSLVAKYLRNPRLLILLLILIIGLGTTSYLTLPRRLNPEIKIPIVLVSTILPGAGPADVESLITVPLEDAVSGIAKVKTVSSTSQDSVSVMTLEFESGVDPDKAKTDVQSAVDSVNNLPKDAKSPKVVKLDFENQPVWTYTLTGQNDSASLMRLSKTIRDKVKDLPSIERVETSGLDTQEVQIVLRPDAIAAYGINPFTISSLIQSALSAYPAGYVKTQDATYLVSIDPQVASADDIRTLKININGTTVALSDIAEVKERSKPDQKGSFLASQIADAKTSVTFYVFKTSSANIDASVHEAQKEVDAILQPYNGTYAVKTVINNATEIADQFDELVRDFWITIGLIVIVLFIFLGLRQALVAAFSAPLTFLITFTIMQATGITLNFLSMFSLLLALGLLVDDTVVVISAMTAYHRTGKFTPFQTGLLVWRDFIVAIFTTTITTVWAFLPLLLSTGIIGEFIKSIPIVVSTTLLASFFVAMFITLPVIIILLKPQFPKRAITFFKALFLLILIGILLSVLPKGPLFPFAVLAVIVFLFVTQTVRLSLIKKSKDSYEDLRAHNMTVQKLPAFFDNGVIHFNKISNRYQRLISKILLSSKNRKMAIAMVIIFSLFSYSLLPLGFVKNEFFPKSDNDFLYLSLELPPGTNIQTTQKEALKLLEEIRTVPESEFVTLELGRVNGSNGGTQEGESNTALLTLRLKAANERKLSSVDLAENLRKEYADYNTGKLSVVEESGGPPAGADLQIKLFGDDLTTLNTYAEKVEKELKNKKGVNNVTKSIVSGTSKIVFTPDMAKLAENNVNLETIGFWLRFYASGFSPDTIRMAEDNNQEKDITLRMQEGTQNPETIDSIRIPTSNGPLLLGSLGTLRLEPNPTLITREEGKRTISISASVSKGYTTSELNKELETFATDKLDLPQGYYWKTGGVNDENNKSVQSILMAMLLSFVLITVTMVLQFASFRKALIVMLVIPLSISGVFIIFALTNTPLSFPALIGVLALFGIVVKNSILIVDKIKQNEETGMPFVDAVIDGSTSRLEAIALTSFCAIIGLIPITLSDPLWRGLGGAIIAGLTFSGTIMLFFIPVVYYYWFVPKEKTKKD